MGAERWWSAALPFGASLAPPAGLRLHTHVRTTHTHAACPRATRWLLVTNGDNEYDQDMMATLASHGDAEVVAFDYYSRFQRPTGEARRLLLLLWW
jgi:hypothetical protein